MLKQPPLGIYVYTLNDSTVAAITKKKASMIELQFKC